MCIINIYLLAFNVQVNAMYKGKTLLHMVVAEGSINAVRVLLRHKADVAARVSGFVVTGGWLPVRLHYSGTSEQGTLWG